MWRGQDCRFEHDDGISEQAKADVDGSVLRFEGEKRSRFGVRWIRYILADSVLTSCHATCDI